MTDYYTFKLNLKHYILKKYSSESEKENLFLNMIPQNLDRILGRGVILNNNYIKYTIAHKTDNLFRTNELYESFLDLKDKTELMYQKYSNLLNEFDRTGNVMYPSEYIKLNEECKQERYRLESRIPELFQVYKDIRDYEVSNSLNFNNTLGIGLSHFFKMEKINYYMELVDIQFESLYDTKNECFYFEKMSSTNEKDFKNVKMYANILVDLLNTDKEFNDELGKITIIEQYEEIKLSETTNKVSIDLVYPNASIENDITTELSDLSIQAGAEKLKVDFEGKDLKVSNIEKLLTREGLSGYVRNVTSKGRKLVLKITSF